jgi:hypothetical protein
MVVDELKVTPELGVASNDEIQMTNDEECSSDE